MNRDWWGLIWGLLLLLLWLGFFTWLFYCPRRKSEMKKGVSDAE